MSSQHCLASASRLKKTRGARTTIEKKETQHLGESTSSLSLPISSSVYVPSFHVYFRCFIVMRLISVKYNTITDCDEVYNYWEPLHYLMYGHGFQTWEYSPMFGLRSYWYLILHGLGSWGVKSLVYFDTSMDWKTKLSMFYSGRMFLALICAWSETWFIKGCQRRLGAKVAQMLALFLFFSNGMFHASTALLPSSFVMYAVMLLYGAWFHDRYRLAIAVGVIAVLWGWPYVGVMFLPFAVDILYRHGGVAPIFFGGIFASLALVPELLINRWYYQRWIFPAWNIVKYNVFNAMTSSSSSSALYGVEPWTFYFKNAFLNLNLVSLLALPTIFLPFLGLKSGCCKAPVPATMPHIIQLTVYLSPLYIWYIIMLVQPHKEERFLYPIYPLLCLSAALTLRMVDDAAVQLFQVRFSWMPRVVQATIKLILLLSTLLSITRTWANTINYSAPMEVFQYLHDDELSHSTSATLCLAKEWYRFPSHFFIPSNRTRVAFLPSGFRGQLPKLYAHVNGTFNIPSDMNDMNREESSRYVSAASCDYVVDLDTLAPSLEDEAWKSELEFMEWNRIYTRPFLLAAQSSSLYRAFYVPILSPRHTVFANYSVYKKQRKANRIV